MAQEPLATKGNYLHIYDFRVQKGHEEEFITSRSSTTRTAIPCTSRRRR